MKRRLDAKDYEEFKRGVNQIRDYREEMMDTYEDLKVMPEPHHLEIVLQDLENIGKELQEHLSILTDAVAKNKDASAVHMKAEAESIMGDAPSSAPSPAHGAENDTA